MKTRTPLALVGLLPAIVINTVLVSGLSAAEDVVPAADRIDDRLLEAATREAVRNALATLAARIQADGNDTEYVLPPYVQYTTVDHKTVERRYSKKTVTEPIWKREHREVERVVPVRDEYGDITGYKKVRQRVEVSRVKVGEKQVVREVHDPNGPIVKYHKYPIREQDGPALLQRGFYGHNAMALYAFAKAGLAEDDFARDIAREMALLIESYGPPDTTWDLSWLVAGYVSLGDEQYDELIEKLASKLIDGQVRERRATSAGLWGPVSIHYGVLASFFEIELGLIDDIKQIEKQMEGLDPRMAKRAEQLIERNQLALNEVQLALQENSQLGRAMKKVTRKWELDELTHVEGLPVYIYNRILADVESTAAAAFGLHAAAAAEKLPQATRRVAPAGKRIAAPETTNRTITAAFQALTKLQDRGGGWPEGNALETNTAFDRSRVPFEGVPHRGPQPQLSDLQTLESDVAGYSALHHLALASPVIARGYTARADEARAAAMAAVDRVIEAANWGKLPTAQKPVVEAVFEANQPARRDAPRRPRDAGEGEPEKPVGYGPAAYRMLPDALALIRPGENEPPSVAADAQRKRLTLRLLREQRDDGQWATGNGRGGHVSSSEWPMMVIQRAEHLRRRPNKEVTLEELNRNSFGDSRFAHTGDHALYPTLAALVYLVEQLDEPIDFSEVTILPEPEDDADAEPAEGDEEPKEPAPLSPNKAASLVERPNAALVLLEEAIRTGVAPPPATAAEASADGEGDREADAE